MQNYKLTPNNSVSENPVELVEKMVFFKTNIGEACLRIVLLTADNRELPYWLVQILHDYSSEENVRYALNYAVYPSKDVLERITGGLLTTVDHIIGCLNICHSEGIKAYRVENGQDYTKMLWNNFDALDAKVSPDIDKAIIAWLGSNS